MKYLFTYMFDGECGIGQASVMMTTNANKITTELIANAVEWVKNDLAEKGMKINSIVPMGWYKFDDEDLISKLSEKNVDNVGLVCDIFDKMTRDDQIKVWQYVNEVMEGE